MDKRELVQKCSMFERLSEDQINEVLGVCTLKEYGNKEIIYMAGDKPDGLYGVIDGLVRFDNSVATGKEMMLGMAEIGMWFGECELFEDNLRISRAKANGRTRLLFLPLRDLMNIFKQSPDLLFGVTEMLCRKVGVFSAYLTSSTLYNVDVRLAKLLLQLCTSFGEPVEKGIKINYKLPQEELGNMLGTSRQTISKLLNQWSEEGLLGINYGCITLYDRNALNNIISNAQ